MQKKLLMVLGPTEVEREILDIASEPLEYMRTEDYSQKWEQIFSGLKYVFQTKNPVVVFSSSGTGAMEAAVTNFLSANDSVLYINAGSFGKRWGDLKILLKNALYHIDGECGMVHLRKALKTGPSVVLFGPTPIKFFSYSNNRFFLLN